MHFSPAFVFFFPSNHFFPRPPLSFPISVTAALTKTLTYPSTLGGHTLNARGVSWRTPTFEMSYGCLGPGGLRGVPGAWGSEKNAPFVGKERHAGERKNSHGIKPRSFELGPNVNLRVRTGMQRSLPPVSCNQPEGPRFPAKHWTGAAGPSCSYRSKQLLL